PEKFIEAATEMPARLDCDTARLRDIEPHHLEKDRVGTLDAVRHDDDRDAPDRQCRARPEREPRPGIDAATSNAIAVMQCRDARRRIPRFGEFRRLVAIEMRIEMVVQPVAVRFGGERGVVDDAEQRAFDAGLYES